MSFFLPVLGGALIGLAAVWLFHSLGRIAGISGIAAEAIRSLRATSEDGEDRWWTWFFLAGLGLGGAIAYAITGAEVTGPWTGADAVRLLAGGVIVGIGTRLGAGCTSGHGVCGLARFSLRSLAATGCFLAVGMITATTIWWVTP